MLKEYPENETPSGQTNFIWKVVDVVITCILSPKFCNRQMGKLTHSVILSARAVPLEDAPPRSKNTIPTSYVISWSRLKRQPWRANQLQIRIIASRVGGIQCLNYP